VKTKSPLGKHPSNKLSQLTRGADRDAFKALTISWPKVGAASCPRTLQAQAMDSLAIMPDCDSILSVGEGQLK
jgi:hypothetical protein